MVLTPLQSTILQFRELMRVNSQAFRPHDKLVLQRADGTELVVADVVSDDNGGTKFNG